MKKLTKLISVFALASAVCVGVGLVTGCQGCGGEEGDGIVNKSDGVGITMTKTTTEYTLDNSLTANIALDDIAVSYVMDDGSDGGAVKEYTLKYYKGQEELTEEDMAVAESGAYNIWAYAKYKTSEGEVKEAETFKIVYVLDDVTGITFNSEAAGTVTTQETSPVDSMSSTWSFTVTYASGNTETVTADDENLTITGVTTSAATDNGVATVEYLYTNEKGEETKVNTSVNYTVTAASSQQTYEYAFSYSELTAVLTERLGLAPADKTALTAADFTGSNSFITFISEGSASSDQYRTSGGGCIEIKGDRLQVTFQGTGTISVMVSSTGGTNASRFGIKNSAGQYIAASDFTGATAVAAGDVDEGTYEVVGTAYVTLTYVINEAGTYTLCSPSSVTTRGIRIQEINMTDVAEGGSSSGGSDTPAVQGVSINLGSLEAYSGLSTTNKTTTLAPNTEIVAGSGVSTIGTADYTVEYSAKNISGSTEKPTVRLKFGGAADFTAGTNALKIVTADAATITLCIRSSSDSASRQIAMFGEDYAQIGEAVTINEIMDGLVYEVTFTVDAAGTYYFGSVSGGIGIYSIAVNYGA